MAPRADPSLTFRSGRSNGRTWCRNWRCRSRSRLLRCPCLARPRPPQTWRTVCERSRSCSAGISDGDVRSPSGTVLQTPCRMRHRQTRKEARVQPPSALPLLYSMANRLVTQERRRAGRGRENDRADGGAVVVHTRGDSGVAGSLTCETHLVAILFAGRRRRAAACRDGAAAG